MLDFVEIRTRCPKRGIVEIYPEFITKRSNDLMIRGKSFYAIWDEEKKLWSTDEYDVRRLIDQMIYDFADEFETEDTKILKLLSNFSTKKWTEWLQYTKSLPDNFHELDVRITFNNSKFNKRDYISKFVDYAIGESDTPAYDKMIGTLYDEDNRRKIEWAIGAIISGDSKMIQKFLVLYGAPGSGKSTVLNIIESLFPGYCSSFDSRALATANNVFALESFRTNPLIAIQHDGDLSRIEDNTKLNSIVSHEKMIINEKFKSAYTSQLNCFLIMATNKPVKITDAKSGIIRRLIDVNPSGNTLPYNEYEKLKHDLTFELGGIAHHCLKVYESMGPNYYSNYVPQMMISATNDFYNFIIDNYEFFVIENPDTMKLSVAWLRYKDYCQDANVMYPFSKKTFKEELKNYYEEFYEHTRNESNVYVKFIKSKLDYKFDKPNMDSKKLWLEKSLIFTESLLDEMLREMPAQYATKNETPLKKWDSVKTHLKDISTSRLHYVKVPKQMIVIDFDLKDVDGNKSFELNLEAASKWPETYAELSKGGQGIHLHYIYDGDVEDLSNYYDENIEIKVFNGDSSLRRRLSKCNDIKVAHINSGLPLKRRRNKNMVNDYTLRSEKELRLRIIKNIKKEYHQNTKPSVDFIYKLLEDAYNQGLKYDVTDLRNDIQQFALQSTHNSGYCLKLVSKMHFKSDEPSENIETRGEAPMVFYDIEVFPNLFVFAYKIYHKEKTILFNPSPDEVHEIFKKYRMIGFNNRKYDNHICYARMMGYTNEQLFRLSQRIIQDKDDKSSFFGEAYNLSYTDVLDFLSNDGKMSLKKWEIKLGIHHLELGLPWDKPVPKKLWRKVGEYCGYDVDATEAVFDANQGDWLARLILADLAGMTPNDTTNTLTTRIIIGKDKDPWSKYIYTDLSTIFPGYRYDPYGIPVEEYDDPKQIKKGKSIYRGEDPSEGGYVYAEPGMYSNVALLDVESMHPHSVIRLKIFGEEYTMRFEEVLLTRLYIKHGMYEEARSFLDGRLAKYLDDQSNAEKLSKALKTAINSVYGLTSANFENKLKDPRNIDNIVAKYGALFMINLKHEVQDRGYTVVHIKTDSIKIANADQEIIDFCMDYAKEYGFKFEHEATYSKICLVNDSVYIAKYKVPKIDKKSGKEVKWTATGAQFKIPYVFKTLFSKEPIDFKDLCETKTVSTELYLDFNENLGNDEHNYVFVGKVGEFCPVKDGYGGGILLRKSDEDKYSAVVGTKKKNGDGIYRWFESEVCLENGGIDIIDRSYHNNLVDEAIETIKKFGNYEWFISEDDDLAA